MATLIRDLANEAAEVREAAVRSLLSCDPGVVEVPLLRVVIGAETCAVLRRGATRVLQLLNLRRALGHVRGQEREQAIRALVALGDDARWALEPALRGCDPIVRRNARRVLETLDEASRVR